MAAGHIDRAQAIGPKVHIFTLTPGQGGRVYAEHIPPKAQRVSANVDALWPVWVAKDVCGVLGLSNPSEACANLEEGSEKITVRIADGNRGNPNATGLTEAGLYRLVFKSTKPEAERVKRWCSRMQDL